MLHLGFERAGCNFFPCHIFPHKMLHLGFERAPLFLELQNHEKHPVAINSAISHNSNLPAIHLLYAEAFIA